MSPGPEPERGEAEVTNEEKLDNAIDDFVAQLPALADALEEAARGLRELVKQAAPPRPLSPEWHQATLDRAKGEDKPCS
jgi:hypothetical protein